MSKTILGKVSVTPKQAYNSTTAYERLDIVTHDGCSYMCLKECTGVAVTNTEYWQLLADKGHFTQEDKEEFKQAVVENSKTEINEHTETKKTELDNYTTAKETSLKNELDTYTETKESELDTHKTTLETEMTNTKDSLVEEIETAQNGFDTNAQTKLQEYNNNATAKTTAFNNNVTEKTNAFNSNVETKTTEFNNNSTTKLEEYNENSTEKIGTFNSNAQAKIEEFNENVESYKSRINELEGIVSQLPAVEDSGSDFKLENTLDAQLVDSKVMGATWQENFLGYNVFDYSDTTWDKTIKNTYIFAKLKDLKPNTEYSIYNYNQINDNEITHIYITKNTSVPINIIKSIRVNGNWITTTKFTSSDTGVAYLAMYNNTNVTEDEWNKFRECFNKAIIVEGSDISRPYEPYVGGTASPNVQYPQPIYNVSGDVQAITRTENFFDKNTLVEGYRIVWTTGNLFSEPGALLSDFINIPTQQRIFFSSTVAVAGYDKDKKYVGAYTSSSEDWLKSNGSIITSLVNYNKEVKFIKIISYNVGSASTIDPNTFQVKLKKDFNKYVPHKQTSVTFPLAEGQVLCEGDYLAEDGIHKIKGKYELTTRNNIHNTTLFGTNFNYVTYMPPNIFKTDRNYNFVCDRVHKANGKYSAYGGYVTSGSFVVMLDKTDTLETANEKLTGTIVEYPLAEEIVEAYTPAQQTAYNELKKLRSFADTTYVVTSSGDLEPVVEVKALEKVASASEINEIKQAVVALGGTL